MGSRPRSGTELNGNVNRLPTEVDRFNGAAQPDIKARVAALEIGKARDQPLGGERGVSPDVERLVRFPVDEPPGCGGDRCKRLLDLRGEKGASLGKTRPVTVSVEETNP